MDQAVLGENDVGRDGAHDVHLAVVGGENEVGVLEDARVLRGLDQIAEPVIHLVEALLYALGEQAGGVAIAVHVRRVHHQQIGLEFANHRRGAAHDEAVGVRVLAVAVDDEVQVRVDDLLQHLLAAAGAGEALPGGLAGELRPEFVDQIVDGRVVARDRPEHRRRGQSRGLGVVENGARADRVAEVNPRRGQLAHDDLLVVDHAVPVGIYAGHHRAVAGIGDGGIDAANPVDAAHLRPVAAEIRKRFENLDIFIDHCVVGNDDQMLCHGENLLYVFDRFHYKPESVEHQCRSMCFFCGSRRVFSGKRLTGNG